MMLDPVRPGVPSLENGAQHDHRGRQGLLHRVAEGRRGHLHLADLVDHDSRAAAHRVSDRRDTNAVEGVHIDAILADARLATTIGVSQDGSLAVERQEDEGDPVAPLSDFFREEPSCGSSETIERSSQARGLAHAGPASQQPSAYNPG